MEKILTNRKQFAKVLKRTKVAENTIELRLKLEEPFEFVPGQYVWLELQELLFPDPKGERRAMSITNLPNEEGEIVLLMRVSKSGFKRTIIKLKKGDEIFIHGPFGSSFLLPEDETVPLICVAGGTGISPFISLLRATIQEKRKTPFTILYADVSKKRIVFEDELRNAEKEQTNCKCIFSFENMQWKDFESIPNLQEATFFISGPKLFVYYVNTLLLENGIFKHQLIFEAEYPTSEFSKPLQSAFLSLEREDSNNLQSLFNKESILMRAVEDSAEHVVVTDHEGRVVYANKQAEKLTGFSFEEMKVNTPRLWGGLMSTDFYKQLWKLKLSGESIETEITNRRKDGTIYYTQAHIASIKDNNEQVIGFIAMESDITLLKNTEKQARENEERFRQLTERIPEIF